MLYKELYDTAITYKRMFLIRSVMSNNQSKMQFTISVYIQGTDTDGRNRIVSHLLCIARMRGPCMSLRAISIELGRVAFHRYHLYNVYR